MVIIRETSLSTTPAESTSGAAKDANLNTTEHHNHLASITHIESQLHNAEKILAHLASSYPDDPDIKHALADVRNDISGRNFTSSAVQRAGRLIIARDKDIRENKAAESEEAYDALHAHDKKPTGVIASIGRLVGFTSTETTQQTPTSTAQEPTDTPEHTIAKHKRDAIIAGDLAEEPLTSPQQHEPSSKRSTHTSPYNSETHQTTPDRSGNRQRPLTSTSSDAHTSSPIHRTSHEPTTEKKTTSNSARATSPEPHIPSPESRTPKKHGDLGKLDSKAGKNITRTTLGVNAAAAINAAMDGDTDAALHYTENVATNATMEAATHKGAQQATVKTAEKLGIAGFKAVSAKVPVWGGVVAGVFAIYDIGKEAIALAKGESNTNKLTSVALSGAAQVAGGVVGFGAGELGQEAVHHATKKMFGEKDAAGHSATVEVAMLTKELLAQKNKTPTPNQGIIAKSPPLSLNSQLSKLLPELNNAGLGRTLGNKDGNLTLDEVKTILDNNKINIADINKHAKGQTKDVSITASELIITLRERGVIDTPTISSARLNTPHPKPQSATNHPPTTQ